MPSPSSNWRLRKSLRNAPGSPGVRFPATFAGKESCVGTGVSCGACTYLWAVDCWSPVSENVYDSSQAPGVRPLRNGSVAERGEREPRVTNSPTPCKNGCSFPYTQSESQILALAPGENLTVSVQFNKCLTARTSERPLWRPGLFSGFFWLRFLSWRAELATKPPSPPRSALSQSSQDGPCLGFVLSTLFLLEWEPEPCSGDAGPRVRGRVSGTSCAVSPWPSRLFSETPPAMQPWLGCGFMSVEPPHFACPGASLAFLPTPSGSASLALIVQFFPGLLPDKALLSHLTIGEAKRSRLSSARLDCGCSQPISRQVLQQVLT